MVLKDLKLSQLRELFPDIKARSKDEFLNELAIVQEVDYETISNEEVVEVENEPKKLSELTADEPIINLELEQKALENMKIADDYGKSKGLVSEEGVITAIVESIETRKKILVKCSDSVEADNMFEITRVELFPLLEKRGISILASSPRRDMSINGTLYVRYACKTNYNLVKTLAKFDTFLELV